MVHAREWGRGKWGVSVQWVQDEEFWRRMDVVVAQHCECTWRHQTVHIKMVKMANFMLCVFCYIIFKNNNFKNQKCRFLNSVCILQIGFSGGELRNCFSKLCVWFPRACYTWALPGCNVAHTHSGKPGPSLQGMGWATHKKPPAATIRNHCWHSNGNHTIHFSFAWTM